MTYRQYGDAGIALKEANGLLSKEEGETVYSAPEQTGGNLFEFPKGELMNQYLENYLFSVLNVKAKQVGGLTGNRGNLPLHCQIPI